jgi:formate C-acetyltransferase
VQVTVTSPEELLDALENPEAHRDLIVRVGGYCDYFVNLTDGLRKAVVERNIHEM